MAENSNGSNTGLYVTGGIIIVLLIIVLFREKIYGLFTGGATVPPAPPLTEPPKVDITNQAGEITSQQVTPVSVNDPDAVNAINNMAKYWASEKSVVDTHIKNLGIDQYFENAATLNAYPTPSGINKGYFGKVSTITPGVIAKILWVNGKFGSSYKYPSRFEEVNGKYPELDPTIMSKTGLTSIGSIPSNNYSGGMAAFLQRVGELDQRMRQIAIQTLQAQGWIFTDA